MAALRGAPDLVVEVLSPNPRIGRPDERVRWFGEHGVRECWVVHQDRRDITVIEYGDRTILARTVFQRQARIRSHVLPEFAQSFDEIME